MNKMELVDAVSEACNLSKKDADSAITNTLIEITKALERGEQVKLSGFGTFYVKDRKERIGTIPGTMTKIKIEATRTVAFKPSKTIKDSVK